MEFKIEKVDILSATSKKKSGIKKNRTITSSCGKNPIERFLVPVSRTNTRRTGNSLSDKSLNIKLKSLTIQNKPSFLNDENSEERPIKKKLSKEIKQMLEDPQEEIVENQQNEFLDQFFLEFYLDITENTEDNYENYVYSCLKSSYYLPINKIEEKLKLMKKIQLPGNSEKKTLFLDLDETLIHSDFELKYDNHSFEIEIENQILPIIIRPELNDFLEIIYKDFEVVLYTASAKEYADKVLKFIDPQNIYFSHRLYRENCILLREGIYLKDLRIVENRKLENMVLIDNNIYCFINQLNNGILVPSFYNNMDDNFLSCLIGYLQSEVLKSEDVTKTNYEAFGFIKMKEAVKIINE